MNIGDVSSVCRVVRLVGLFSGALDHNSGFVKVYLVCRRFLAFAVAVHAEFPFRSFLFIHGLPLFTSSVNNLSIFSCKLTRCKL